MSSFCGASVTPGAVQIALISRSFPSWAVCITLSYGVKPVPKGCFLNLLRTVSTLTLWTQASNMTPYSCGWPPTAPSFSVDTLMRMKQKCVPVVSPEISQTSLYVPLKASFLKNTMHFAVTITNTLSFCYSFRSGCEIFFSSSAASPCYILWPEVVVFSFFSWLLRSKGICSDWVFSGTEDGLALFSKPSGSAVISRLSEHNGWKLSYYLSVLSKGKGSHGAERPRKTLVLILLKGVGWPGEILFSSDAV